MMQSMQRILWPKMSVVASKNHTAEVNQKCQELGPAPYYKFLTAMEDFVHQFSLL